MKKKFNLLCVVMLLALVFVAAAPVVGLLASGYTMGFNRDEMKQTQVKGSTTSVGVLPKGTPIKFTHEIVNEKNGQVEKMQIVQAIVNSTEEPLAQHAAFNIALPVLGVLTAGVLIAILVIFVKIILAVNRSLIFDQRMERRLAWCGALMIAEYAIEWLITYSNYLHCKSMFEFADYIITIIKYPDGPVLLAGVGMLLIAQIFKIARQLEEEQELTI